MSVRWKQPGLGITTFDFIVSKLIGDSDSRLLETFKVLTVNGLEWNDTEMILKWYWLRLHSKELGVTHRPVCCLSFCNNVDRITRVRRICRSDSPTIWLARGGCRSVQYTCKLLHFCEDTARLHPDSFFNARCNSFSALTKFVPWSQRSSRITPRRALSRVTALMK